MSKQQVSAHPRLYIGQKELQRLSSPEQSGWRKEAKRLLLAKGRYFIKQAELQHPKNCHNEHLVRARAMQTKITTLATCWILTNREIFRTAIIKAIAEMGQWKYWSWIAWRKGDSRPDAIFDLSYGENSATLAIAFDLLHDSLSAEEHAMFINIAKKRPVASAVKNIKSGKAWWFGRPMSNWNTVCAGGIGMLAMAMFEDIKQAPELITLTDQSITPFMQTLDKTNGGWPEGVGYWNYGMRYAFMYLLSHERAFGKPHPLLKLKGARKTLQFPIDFTPNGLACGFGDANGWNPMPFHFAAAQRLDCNNILHSLQKVMEDSPKTVLNNNTWPSLAEALLLCPDQKPVQKNKTSVPQNRIKLYKGLDWGIITDNPDAPKIAVTVRGGSTNVPHAHQDLLSFQCVIGKERAITNVNDGAYLDTTFSPRRHELFGISPFSKNTILINGVGIVPGSELKSTRKLTGQDAEGFRLDATGAFGKSHDNIAVTFCCRVILLVKKKYILVIDRAELPHVGVVESRMFTPAKVKQAKADATLAGKKLKLRVAYAASVPASLNPGMSTPTIADATEHTMLRWITKAQVKAVTMATLLAPGAGSAKVDLKETDRHIQISLKDNRQTHNLCLTKHMTSFKKV